MSWLEVLEEEAGRVDDAGVEVQLVGGGPAAGVAVGVVPGDQDER